MTRPEICQAISDKLEPFESLVYAVRSGRISPKGFWRYDSIPEWGWYPLDYFSSEDASARLLDWLREKANPDGFIDTTALVALERLFDRLMDKKVDRKIAVLLAVCEFLAITLREEQVWTQK